MPDIDAALDSILPAVMHLAVRGCMPPMSRCFASLVMAQAGGPLPSLIRIASKRAGRLAGPRDGVLLHRCGGAAAGRQGAR